MTKSHGDGKMIEVKKSGSSSRGGENIVLQVDIRIKLKECLGGRIEVTTKDKGRITGVLEWLSPDQQMAEIRLNNGEIRTVCDTEIVGIRPILRV